MQITELILETHSLPRTRLFYQKTLELDLISETDHELCFRAGRSLLRFRHTENQKPYYHFAFNITNNKFSDAFEWINQKLDILPVSDDMLIASYENWNAQSFYFYDNNGSILEFIVRFDLPYYRPEAFSSRCIEEISEIGWVTDNVAETAAALHQKWRIPYFEKGPRQPDFIAMGDEYGLILVSQQKRGWVPNQKPARAFPLHIAALPDIQIDGQKY